MTALADADLLAVWENFGARPLIVRALALIQACASGDVSQPVGEIRVGEFNRRLLVLHRQAFGPTVCCVTPCEACAETVEIDVDLDTLASSLPVDMPRSMERLESAGYVLDLTAPTVDDCIAAAAAVDAEDGYRRLLARCVSVHEPHGEAVRSEALPPAVMDAIDAQLASLDPGAELLLAYDCPACGRANTASLDMAAFCWAEVESRSSRLLTEVHLLASRYGWSERSILDLSPARRRHYLGLASHS